MAEFVDADLSGSLFRNVDLSGSRLRSVFMQHVRISDAYIVDLDISAHIEQVVVNGVDVTEFVDAELNRRDPERAMLGATEPDDLRATWAMIERRAAATLQRARALPAAALDESVDDEYSYLQTLRHLVFAFDRWLTGPVFGDPQPFHPLGQPYEGADEHELRGLTLDARPSLDEVLALREARLARGRELLAGATDADLSREVDSPNGGTTTVRHCIQVVLREEWAHDGYARRDLAILTEGAHSKPGGGS